jgi:serine/threonine-protein kinase
MTGKQLGAYGVLEKLGEGGMGEVYRAHDPRLQRDVAIKLLPSAFAGHEDARSRLLREARAAAALNHPHICTIYEVGDADGQAYIAMELVEGRPLDRVIPAGGLGESDLFTYGVQIADGVAHAHDKGVLHRDLKTANIMITGDGRAKVLDFGLAKRVTTDRPDVTTEVSSVATQPGIVAGTLAYMAPEQLRGEPATTASDVWALGVVLYEMASGRRPFDGKTGFEIASAILEQSPPSLPATVPTIVRGMINRCLAKEPSHRYRSAGELRAALEAVRSGHVPPALPALGVTEMAPPLVTRAPRPPAALTALAILAIAAVFAVLAWRGAITLPARLSTPPRIASIAVLPLDNLSGQADEDYFAAGMQDGLITELARLRTLDRVIERRSTRRFANTDQPIAEIAKTLNVDAIVTGSVRRAGERVVVSAQLIDGATERHLWTNSFERDARDVLSIQSDVVQAVATAIGADIALEDRQRLSKSRRVDPATYEAYLRGMHLVNRGPGTRADRLRGLAILQEAIDLDPGNAHAYAGLALGYVTLGHGPLGEPDVWPKARAAAQRAVTLDPTLAEGYSALAEVLMYYERDWAGSEQAFKRANELNPNLAMNHYHYSWYLALFRRWDEAIAEHKRAQELDPLTPQHTAFLGLLYLYLDRFDEAMAEAKSAIQFAPNAPAPWGVLAWALLGKGQHEEAEAAMAKGAAINPGLLEFELGLIKAARGKQDEARVILAKLEAQPTMAFSGWSLSQLYLALGDTDSAFKWLNHRPAHAFIPWARVHPTYKAIRNDPRMAALMAEMKVP